MTAHLPGPTRPHATLLLLVLCHAYLLVSVLVLAPAGCTPTFGAPLGFAFHTRNVRPRSAPRCPAATQRRWWRTARERFCIFGAPALGAWASPCARGSPCGTQPSPCVSRGHLTYLRHCARRVPRPARPASHYNLRATAQAARTRSPPLRPSARPSATVPPPGDEPGQTNPRGPHSNGRWQRTCA